METARSTSWRSFAFAAAIFAAMVLLVFHDTLYRSDIVVGSAHGDIWGQFYPWREFGFGELRRGRLALWNPWLFSGAPFLGAFQSALLYPPNWLFMLLPTALAMNVGIALHVFLAGMFMYCWAAYRQLRWPACVAAGLVFMFGGQEFGRATGNLSNLDTLVWAPLIFLALDDLTITRSLRGALVGSVAFAMQVFAGHPQYAFYTAVAATIYFALNLYAAPSRWRAIAGYGLCFAGGGLLAAAQLFTGLGATAEAMRSHAAMAFAGTFSFPPENLITLVLPAFFGDGINSPYWGRWFWVEANVYVGAVAVVLACFALGKPMRPRRFAFTMLIVTLVLGVGAYTPAFWAIYHLPMFSSFRGLSKMMFLFVMFMALLAGMGLDRLLGAGMKRMWPAIVAAGAALVLLALAAIVNASALSDFASPWGRLLGWIDWSDNRTLHQPVDLDFLYHSAKTAAGNLCWAGIILLALAGLLFAGRRYRRALWGIPLLMAVEFAAFAIPLLPEYSMADYRAQIAAVRQFLAPLPADARVWAFDQGELFLAGRLNAWGNDPMMLRRYVEFLGNALGVDPDSLLIKGPPLPSHANRLFRLIRMSGVLILDEHRPHLYPLNPPILPRAELVGAARVGPDRAALLSAMNDPHFDPLHTALIESPINPAPAGADDPGRVTVRDIDSDTLDIEAWANSPCLLVITDSYSTGWHAEALPDSAQKQYQVIPADLTLRGVALSAGHHHFRLIYRPLTFVIGKWTSLAAMIGYLALGGIWWRGRNGNPRGTGS